MPRGCPLTALVSAAPRPTTGCGTSPSTASPRSNEQFAKAATTLPGYASVTTSMRSPPILTRCAAALRPTRRTCWRRLPGGRPMTSGSTRCSPPSPTSAPPPTEHSWLTTASLGLPRQGARRAKFYRRGQPALPRRRDRRRPGAEQVVHVAVPVVGAVAAVLAGSEPGTEEGGGLVDGGSRGAGLAERVEQHEVVDDAVVTHGCHR